LILSLGAAGCGGSLYDAAGSGDLDAFRARVAERAKEGEVDADEARSVARRFMAHEIETAEGPTGKRGLESLEVCAVEFDSALAARADKDDELAALAALMRAEAGGLSPLSQKERVNDPTPYWRAVAARTLVVTTPSPSEASGSGRGRAQAARWRRKLMLDPFLVVRRAAVRAAVDSADPRDGHAVLEAGRLDPDEGVRLSAIEAAGAIATRETVLGLKDLWVNADEKGRVAIVGAWNAAWRKRPDDRRCETPAQTGPCIAFQQLATVSQTDEGMPGLVAALELIHDARPDGATVEQAFAAAVVERRIDEAPSRIRVEAIASAPLAFPHLTEAIVEALGTPDDRVKVAAMSRMTELTPKERSRALKGLRKLARDKGVVGEAARRALVRAGDGQVRKLLAHDARAASALQRGRAAARYARIGAMNEALTLLADQDAHVRARAACAILGVDSDTL
jgi:hypothetical protein